jgi:3-deoxy-D-manno-octulosonic-acid transferase
VFWFSYNLLFHAVFLLMLPRFLWRMRRRGGYRKGFGQRLFRVSEDLLSHLSESRKPWIHAVSVGESQVALAFMAEWRRQVPVEQFIVTVNTSTAQAMVRPRLDARDLLLYPPVDSPRVVTKAIRRLRPSVLVLVETEIWPNLLRALRRGGVPVALLNGRISDRSFRRLRRLRFLTRRVYPMVDLFCMQSEEDAERARLLGAPPERVRVLHSAKYDVADRDPTAEALRRQRLLDLGYLVEGDPVLLGSSTWPGEEAALLRAFHALRPEFPRLRLVLVPRHAERAAEVEADLREAGLSWWRASALATAHGPAPDVLLVDTTGELVHYTALADIVFVGKSLGRAEGQNPLEAARAGCAVVAGPGMDNFRRVMADLREAKAIAEIMDEAELSDQIHTWLREPDEAKAQGARASALVESRRGSLARSVGEILRLPILR